MAGKRRNALVAFFEVQDDDNKALATSIDWPEVLAYISSQSMADRRHIINGAFHWGQVYTYKETDHLVLARRRDEVSSLDTSTGEILDSESDATKPWVEVSVVHFVPKSNRLGFVLGSNAAPRVSSVAHWLNTHDVLDQPITIAPVLDQNVVNKIQRADSASLVKVTFETNRVVEDGRSGGLFEVAQDLKNQYGDVVIEMQISVNKDHGGSREREGILGEAQNLAASGLFDKAVAKLAWHEADGSLHSENIDFVKHRLARTMKISLTDKEGKSIKLTSAIEAIYRAYDKIKADLS